MTATIQGTRRAASAIIRRGIIILFTVLSAASVVLGLGVRTEDDWGTCGGRVSKDGTYWTCLTGVGLGKGVVLITYRKHLDGPHIPQYKDTNWPWWKYTARVFYDSVNKHYYQQWEVTASSEVPLVLGILFGIYPTFAFLRGPVRRRRRRRQGLCMNCAYDLTGNISGVCPECGTPVGPKKCRADDSG